MPFSGSKQVMGEMAILHAGIAGNEVLHLKEIAECFGIRVRLVDVERGTSSFLALKKEMGEKAGGFAFDIGSLKAFLEPPERLMSMVALLQKSNVSVLLLATDSDQASNDVISTLTEGEILQVSEQTMPDAVTFPESGKSFSGELSSQAFPREGKRALTLSVRGDATADTIMTLGGLPAFVHRRLGGARIFVWSTRQIFDVRRPLRAELEFELACDEYVPAIVFLRATFGDRCWHNPEPGAGIVIDDPLLKKRYGFIDFEKLLESARNHRYHVTLAFIPWNQWRSRIRDVKLFLDYSDCFSICVHGCDHTRNEYGVADYDALLEKNFVAQERMERHRRRTGLESEPLMVCPQEKYSLEAMEAFSDARQFQGLVCTACMPRNQASPKVSGADLLLPAQDCLFGFPVFKRHYWRDLPVFAMALFLGKPAILVEHHEFFRHGPAGAEDFVRRLAELRPDLEWRSLAQTITRTHARRRLAEGDYEVRFFTDQFELQHQIEEPAKYTLSRRVPEASVVEHVSVRNKKVPFTRENGFARFETHARHPETIPVRVKISPARPKGRYPNGIKYQSSVAVRRGLSELRDSLLSKMISPLRREDS